MTKSKKGQIKVFIDGGEGTTGLRLSARLSLRGDVKLLTLSDKFRKDLNARKDMLNAADYVFLCLPDAAAEQAVEAVENKSVKIIDASTAHRTLKGWTYGFPEFCDDFKACAGNRVAVPGCHASGCLALCYPLIKLGILPVDYPLSFVSVTGYSGGGKKMIAEYEADAEGRNVNKYNDNGGEMCADDRVQDNVNCIRGAESGLRGENVDGYKSPRQYGLTQEHKHLKEIIGVAGLKRAPLFLPYVSDYYSGMQVTLPLYADMLDHDGGAEVLTDAYLSFYASAKLIKIDKFSSAFAPANALSGYDNMKIQIGGNNERIILTATFDNLGKGASGAAIQCFNLMSGADECEGLNLFRE